MQTISCGYYELPTDEVFHYAGYECAAWWTKTLVKAGRYEVLAYVKDGHVDQFCAKLVGTIESDYFQSLYCGMPIGDGYNTKKDAGKPSTHFITIYSYDAPRGKFGRWHIDYSVLPNVGRCIHCGTVTFGHANFGSCLCVTCSVNVGNGDAFVAAMRFPRLLKTLACGRYGNIADQSIADAVFNRSEYHRKDIAGNLRRIRAARRQFGHPEKNWFKVYDDGSVHADGRFLGRVDA